MNPAFPLPRRLLLAAGVAAAALAAHGAALAGGHLQWSVSVGVPVVGAVIGNAPVYAPVYAPIYTPPPVVYAPPPLVYQPAPRVVYAPPPLSYRPAPQVIYGSYGSPHWHAQHPVVREREWRRDGRWDRRERRHWDSDVRREPAWADFGHRARRHGDRDD